jgi:hypothetical protein
VFQKEALGKYFDLRISERKIFLLLAIFQAE